MHEDLAETLHFAFVIILRLSNLFKYTRCEYDFHLRLAKPLKEFFFRNTLVYAILQRSIAFLRYLQPFAIQFT